MKTSQKGLDLIKFFEGLRLNAYLCPAGKRTIGYGHLMKITDEPQITEQEAENILKKDLEYFETEIMKMVKVPLSQNQFDAIVSFTFNLGVGSLGSSTLLQKINNKLFLDCPVELVKWSFIGKERSAGLLKRRLIESCLFLGLDYKLS